MQTSLRNLQQQQQLKPPTNPPSTTEIQQDDAWDPNLIEADDDYDILFVVITCFDSVLR